MRYISDAEDSALSRFWKRYPTLAREFKALLREEQKRLDAEQHARDAEIRAMNEAALAALDER